MNQPSELKPCPFCGGEAVERLEGYTRCWIMCTNCFATSILFNDMPSAIGFWNHRHPDIEAVVKRVVKLASRKPTEHFENGQSELRGLRLDEILSIINKEFGNE